MMDLLFVYTAAVTYNAFQWAGRLPENAPVPADGYTCCVAELALSYL